MTESLGKWAVVDEESMSTEPNAAILAIGATMIDNMTAVDRFYVNVDLQSCLDVGLHESESTRKWWSEQSAEAFNATQTNCVPIQQALQMWSDWIAKHGGRKVRLMGNGPCADNMWLNSAYKACGMKNPVPYWNDICHRTLNWIGAAWFGLDKKDVQFKGVKHHAGDDAEHEAQHALMVLDRLYRKAPTNRLSTETNTDMNKQEFVLNNITSLLKEGMTLSEVESATDILIAAYNKVCSAGTATGGIIVNEPVPKLAATVEQSEEGVTVTIQNEPESTPITTEFDAAVTAGLPDPTQEPTTPEATQAALTDDWGLNWYEKWNAGGFGKAKTGQFKRKPRTNEEEYAHWLRDRVNEARAAGTWTGPDNWMSLARVTKFLPAEPNPQAETLQTPAETIAAAVEPVVNVVPTAPTADTTVPAVNPAPVAPTTTTPVAPVGASAASATPSVQDVMQAHMPLVNKFGATNPTTQVILAAVGAANIMLVPENQRAAYIEVAKCLVEQAESIELDQTGTKVTEILGMFGLTAPTA